MGGGGSVAEWLALALAALLVGACWAERDARLCLAPAAAAIAPAAISQPEPRSAAPTDALIREMLSHD